MELEGQICAQFPFYPYIDIHDWIEVMHDFYHRFERYYKVKSLPNAPILPFLPPYYLPFRVTFYHLIVENQGQIEERFFHTSEISFTLVGNKSVPQNDFLNQGLKPDDFQSMFWKCKIGGPDIKEDIKKDILYLYSLVTNRFIVWLDIEER